MLSMETTFVPSAYANGKSSLFNSVQYWCKFTRASYLGLLSSTNNIYTFSLACSIFIWWAYFKQDQHELYHLTFDPNGIYILIFSVAQSVQKFATLLRVRAPPVMEWNLERAPSDRFTGTICQWHHEGNLGPFDQLAIVCYFSRCLWNVTESREKIASEKLYEKMGPANLLSCLSSYSIQRTKTRGEIILQDASPRKY